MAEKFDKEHSTLQINEDKSFSQGNKSERIDVYDELYDDHDKYFDCVHELYTDIHEYRQQLGSEILACDHFPDFFNFCLEHLNKFEIDQDNKKIINDKWTKSLNKNKTTLSVSIPDSTLVPVAKSKKNHKKNKLELV